MISKRFLSYVLLVSLCLSMLGSEWSWEYSGGIFFWLRGASRIIPSIMLLAAGLMTRAFIPKGDGLRWLGMLLGLAVMGSIFAGHLLTGTSEDLSFIDIRDTIFSIIQAVLCIFVAYQVGKDFHQARNMIKTLVAILTVAIFFDLMLKAVGITGEVGVLKCGWPMALYWMLPYCWYLNRFLTERRISIWTIVALFVTALDIAVAIHKPIIFATAMCTIFLVLFGIRANGFFRVFFRFALLASVSIVGLVVADKISNNRISNKVAEVVESKFLHQDYGKMPSTPWEVVERASGGRFMIWEQAGIRIAERPLFGWGPNKIFEQEELVPGTTRQQYVWHNVYIEMLISIGIVGALPAFISILLWYRLVLRKAVVRSAADLFVPCITFVTGLLCFDLVGSGSTFLTMASIVVSFMAIMAAIADDALKLPSVFQNSDVAQNKLSVILGKKI